NPLEAQLPEFSDDGIFTTQDNHNHLEPFIEFFEKKNTFLEDEFKLSLSFKEIESFLKRFKNLLATKMKNFFYFHWAMLPKNNKSNIRKLSSGEHYFLSLFSRLHDLFISESINGRNCFLLLDECELALHPEWQRKF